MSDDISPFSSDPGAARYELRELVEQCMASNCDDVADAVFSMAYSLVTRLSDQRMRELVDLRNSTASVAAKRRDAALIADVKRGRFCSHRSPGCMCSATPEIVRLVNGNSGDRAPLCTCGNPRGKHTLQCARAPF